MLVECFTSEAVVWVHPVYKSLISKLEKKIKSSRDLFFLLLKIFNSVWMKEAHGKLLAERAEVLHLLNGIFLPVCNAIPREHHAPGFQGKLSSPVSFRRSSAGGDRPQRVEILKALKRSKAGSPHATSACLHRLAWAHSCPHGGHRPCLTLLWAMPLCKCLPRANFQHNNAQQGQLCLFPRAAR